MRPYMIPAGAILAAVLLPDPALAMRREPPSSLAAYVRARAADAAGESETAAAGYAAVLAAEPGDEVVAMRAYGQAMAAGDRALALRAARAMAAKGFVPPVARLLLLADAFQDGDWKAASAIVGQIEADRSFAFAAPVLRAWIAFGARSGDPLAPLADLRAAGTIATVYGNEQRIYLLLATGRTVDGVAAARALAVPANPRATRIRLAAAAIVARSDKAAAIGLLGPGDDPALAAARARIEAGKPLPGAVDTPAAGLAELLVRIAIDVNRERVAPLAVSLARTATFLAPKNGETWLATAELLEATNQPDAALLPLAEVKPDDPLAEAARDTRLRLLVKAGQRDAALREALAAADARTADTGDWTRVGDLYSDLKRPADAAAAYGRALALSDKSGDPSRRWSLLLLQGGALDQAGDWPAARAALSEAVKLAPQQPVALNYLGYAQLERRENLAQAEALIEQASKLKPDDSAITDSLGWTYYLRGNLDRAVPTLERAAAAEPGESTINEHLGDAYWAAGRRLEARYAWRAATVYAEPADVLRLRAKIDGGLTAQTAAK